MVYLKYSNGKFVEDENYTKHGKQAVTIYTGSVLLLEDVNYDCKNRKWIGRKQDGTLLKINPSAIIEMVKI